MHPGPLSYSSEWWPPPGGVRWLHGVSGRPACTPQPGGAAPRSAENRRACCRGAALEGSVLNPHPGPLRSWEHSRGEGRIEERGESSAGRRRKQCKTTPARSRGSGTGGHRGRGERGNSGHTVRGRPAPHCHLLAGAKCCAQPCLKRGAQLHPLAPLSLVLLCVGLSFFICTAKGSGFRKLSSDPTCALAAGQGRRHSLHILLRGTPNPWVSRLPPGGQGPVLVHERL